MVRHNISPEVFYVDRFTKIREHAVIPMERLKIYAHEFKIPVDELFTKQESTSR